jgi:hypothetical protein
MCMGGPMLTGKSISCRLVAFASHSKRNKEAADVADLRFIVHDSINLIECPIIPILARQRARIRNNQGVAVNPVAAFDLVDLAGPKQVRFVFPATGGLDPDRNLRAVRPNVVG